PDSDARDLGGGVPPPGPERHAGGPRAGPPHHDPFSPALIARSGGRGDVGIGSLRSAAPSLPPPAQFALGMAVIFAVPPLARRARVPVVVALLLTGVVFGPNVIGLIGERHPIADFLAELGKLLLMLFAGLEIDLELFRRQRNRSIVFGL